MSPDEAPRLCPRRTLGGGLAFEPQEDVFFFLKEDDFFSSKKEDVFFSF